MGYFKGEDIEAIELELENTKSKSTFCEFLWLSEQTSFELDQFAEKDFSEDKFRLSLFERSKSA